MHEFVNSSLFISKYVEINRKDIYSVVENMTIVFNSNLKKKH